jgi:maltose alpha-D-glucosyltransferase/alpha-amylase
MYRVYAHDPQMRINLGIRRRLAPLLGHNRRRVELLNGLLFALPGTPVLYYGDEIGMGDNTYLGDRNGVRTPMQWSGDRNAGFSGANRQSLFLPVITDPEYHYEAVNVEAQQANPSSLLWWMKRLIALRKNYRAFGRGSLTFLHPENRRIVAFVREHLDERILVVANMSRFVQYADLNLSAYRGLVPVEMFGRVEFPRVEDNPLFLTLGPHAFIWFSLERDPSGRGIEVRPLEEAPPVLGVPADLNALLTGRARSELLGILPGYLRARRWFRSKARRIKGLALHDTIAVPIDGEQHVLAIFDVEYTEGEPERYVLPLALGPSDQADRTLRDTPQAVIAHVLPEGESGQRWILYDALYDPRFGKALLEAIGARKRFKGRRGELTASPTKEFRALRGGRDANLEPRVSRAEQSNTSVMFGDRLILKLIRRLEPGINPELEVGVALTERGFAHTPPVGGWLAYRSARDEPSALGILQAFVPNQGDFWEYMLDQVSAYFEHVAAQDGVPPERTAPSIEAILEASRGELSSSAAETIGEFLDVCGLLGMRTAQLHAAMGRSGEDAAFAPEPFSALYQRSVFQTARNQAAGTFGLLRRRLDSLPATAADQAVKTLDLAAEVQTRLTDLTRAKISGGRIRTHGDFHAGQVLWTGRDFAFIDFEGEPGRPLSERRHKRSALTDVAGMLRSFHYAAFGTLLNPRVGGAVRPEDVGRLEPWADFWYLWVAATFMRAYLAEAQGQHFLPETSEELVTVLDLAMLQKVLYELNYELNNRPDWVSIPLRGLLDIMGEH